MRLGERICQLRTQKQMSQGDLADALQVSRQSISKWETNSSVPELDKLIRLSEIFGVTLDELITGSDRADRHDQPEVKTAAGPTVVYIERSSGRKVAGVVLLCFAALVWLLVSLLGDVLAGLILAVPFAACGLICLLVKKHPGLWCAWVVYLFVEIYLRVATGVNWAFILQPLVYQGGWEIQLIIAWCLFAVLVVLTVTTAFCTRKLAPGSLRTDLIGTVCGWAAFVISRFIFVLPPYNAQNAMTYRIVSTVSGFVRSILAAAALVFTLRLIAALAAKRKKQ